MKKIGIAPSKRERRPTPPTGSVERVAAFWDTHDSSQYFPEGDLVPLRTWTKGKKVRHVYIAPDGLQYEMIPLKRKPKAPIPA